MLTLHKATEETKTILKFGGILLGLILGFLIITNIGGALKELLFPTPPTPPTVTFGKLPKPIFIENSQIKPETFTLNTISGQLPNFPIKLNVYKIKNPQPNLLALQKAKDRASNFGFLLSERSLSPILYQWTDKLSPSRTLTYDITSLNFNIVSDYFSDPNVLNKNSLPTQDVAIKTAQSLIQKLSASYSDIDNSKTKTTLLAINEGGQGLITATSFSAAQVIKVDFFQKDIDNIPITYANPPGSSMNILISPGEREGKVVEANFLHQNVSSESATYPTKSAQDAFNLLKEGKAHMVSYYGQSNGEVLIKNVYLAYYMGNGEQQYLTPVIVFEGNNGFFAYTSAVTDEWIGK